MDIVAYAYATGMLAWFENPSWEEHFINNYTHIVDIDFWDLNGDGLDDFVIAWDLNVPPRSPQEGQIGWLANDYRQEGPWQYHPIADSSNYIPGIHRVRIGHFYDTSSLGVVGIPIFDFGAHGRKYDQVPSTIRYYFAPSTPEATTSPWSSTEVSDSLHICHTVRKYTNESSGTNFLIENSLEGVTRLNFQGKAGSQALLLNLNPGIPPVSWSPFYGSQGTRVGYVDDAPAYMAEVSPWEGGNTSLIVEYTVAILISVQCNASFG